MFFSTIVLIKNKTSHTLKKALLSPPPPPFEMFWKFICFCDAVCDHNNLRDGWRYQNRWIFGKVPNGFDPHPLPLRMAPFSGNHVHVFHTIWPSYLNICNHMWCRQFLKALYPILKNCNIIFQKWWGAVKGSLDFFLNIYPFWYPDPSLCQFESSNSTKKYLLFHKWYWLQFSFHTDHKIVVSCFPKDLHPTASF